MAKATRRLFLLALSATLTLAVTRPDGQAPARGSLDAALAGLDATLAADFARDGIGGASIGVVFGDHLIWSRHYGYADAEAKLRRAVALDPDNVGAKLQLSNAILNRAGDPERAMTVLQGEHPYLKMHRAYFLALQRRYPEAIVVVESVADSPDVFGGQYGPSKAAWLGGLQLEMGHAEKARQYYEQAEATGRRALAEAEAGAEAGGGAASQRLINELQNMADVELGLGRIDDALRLAHRGQALTDALDDDYLGPLFTAVSADLYGRAGRADLAVPLLDRVLASPTGG